MANSVVFPRAQFFSNSGRPLVGGRIHTYVAGSSTRARTYQDAANVQINTNPIILDARGEAAIYLAEGVEYKFVVEDSTGALIMTQEPVYGAIWPNASEWPSDATLSYQYMTEAKAAASASGPIKFYNTKAQADAAIGTMANGDIIEVSQDETRAGARTRYKVQAGALVFVINLDQMRIDLANDTDPTKGAALTGYDGGSVQAVLDDAKPMQGYAALRAYSGRATGVRITSAGIAGFFQRSETDTTSADNGGTVIVDASDRRWKRLYTGFVDVHWFGAIGDGVADDHAAVQAAITAVKNALGGGVWFPTGTYKLSATLVIPEDWPIALIGEGVDATILKYTGASNALSMRRTGSGSVVKCGIEQMRITGNADAVIGLDLYFAYACFVKNVLFDGFRTGISVEQSWSLHFDMVHAVSCTEDGVYLAAESNNIKFTACEFYNCGRAGAYVIGSRAVTFDTCTLETNAYGAVVTSNAARPSHGVAFTGCYIEGNSSAELRITREAGTSPSGVSVLGCYFVCLAGKATQAIRAEYADGLFIEHNFFSAGSATYGYSLLLTDGATLSGVHFGANQDASANGPYLGAGASYRNLSELEPVAKGRFTIADAAIGPVKSFGVANVTRVGVGVYEVTLRQPMPGTDYTVLTDAENGAVYTVMLSSAQPPASTTVFRINTAAPGGSAAEARTVNFTVWK